MKIGRITKLDDKPTLGSVQLDHITFTGEIARDVARHRNELLGCISELEKRLIAAESVIWDLKRRIEILEDQ